MKKYIFLTIIPILVLMAVFSCSASDIDPILLDEPSSIVHECGENLFLEIPGKAAIENVFGGRYAKGYFLFFSAEFLFLEDSVWNGMDKNSFVLKHTGNDGSEEFFALNYMMTSMMSTQNGWKTLSDTYSFGRLVPMYLVFTVPMKTNQGWSLIFQPAERGGTASCSVEIPLKVQ